MRVALLAGLVAALCFVGLSPSSASPSTWSAPQAMAPASSVIAGTTVDSRARAVDDISVEAFAVDAEAGDDPEASDISYGGEFMLVVPAGSYVVRFTDLDDRFLTQEFHDGDAVKVTKNEHVDLGEVTMLREGEIVNTEAPTVKGNAVAGRTVKATPGTWTPDATSYAYQWLIGGRPVAGATSKRFDVPGLKAGKRLSVRVDVSAGGETEAATSKAVTIGRVPTTTALRLKDKTIRSGKRAVAIVKVASADALPLKGKEFRLTGAGTKLGAKLNAKGKATLRLPRLSRGTYRLVAVFPQTTQAAGSRSKRVTLTVRS